MRSVGVRAGESASEPRPGGQHVPQPAGKVPVETVRAAPRPQHPFDERDEEQHERHGDQQRPGRGSLSTGVGGACGVRLWVFVGRCLAVRGLLRRPLGYEVLLGYWSQSTRGVSLHRGG